jgi:hypothetical protein
MLWQQGPLGGQRSAGLSTPLTLAACASARGDSGLCDTLAATTGRADLLDERFDLRLVFADLSALLVELRARLQTPRPMGWAVRLTRHLDCSRCGCGCGWAETGGLLAV